MCLTGKPETTTEYPQVEKSLFLKHHQDIFKVSIAGKTPKVHFCAHKSTFYHIPALIKNILGRFTPTFALKLLSPPSGRASNCTSFDKKHVFHKYVEIPPLNCSFSSFNLNFCNKNIPAVISANVA